MTTEIITSIIALSGVIISIIVTYLSTKRQFKTEIRKVNTTIEQDYLKMILAKRVETYPKIYFELHEFMRIILHHNPTLEELKSFDNKLADLNSLHAVFISARTSNIFYKLRRYVYMIIDKIESKGSDKIVSEDRKNALRENIKKLEIGLKKDLGIYLIEFQDAERKLKIEEKYKELTEIISENE